MNRAEIELVTPDADRGKEFFEQARAFLRDADTSTLSGPGSFFLYYQAALAAMDALLADSGRRVTAGEESHRVRIEAAGQLAGDAYADLFERLELWRADRNQVSYAALQPSAAAVDAIRTDVRELIESVDRLLSGENRHR